MQHLRNTPADEKGRRYDHGQGRRNLATRISSNLSNGLLEAINGNVQAAKRKAKGYRTKHNLKLMVYLIAGGVLDALPI